MTVLGDDLLIRDAARRLALQAAALVAAGMLLLIALVTVVVVREQRSAGEALLRSTAATADDVGDPPPGAWVLVDVRGVVTSSPGLPTGLSTALSAWRAHPGPGVVLRDVATDDGGAYRVATTLRSGRTYQVVLDLGPELAQRDRLLQAMGVAGLLSLVLAAGLGVLLGRRAVRPLAAALTLQRSFVADASHELRTPLTLLSTRVQLLDRELKGLADPVVRQDVAGVVADVHRLSEVVEDLLVAADPRVDESHTELDLAGLVAGALDSAAAHAATRAVTLTGGTPDGGGPLLVRGSAPALRRAVLALVDNAVDHTPEGGEVSVRVERRRADVVVAVSDTGPGIAPAAAASVQQRFHSGGHRSGRAHYGLGLALTHDVANRHRGQLRLAPCAVGTTFELVLPASGAHGDSGSKKRLRMRRHPS